MTKLIQEHTSLSLSQAKSVTDRVLDGEAVVLIIEGDEKAKSLVQQLKEVGADAHIVQE